MTSETHHDTQSGTTLSRRSALLCIALVVVLAMFGQIGPAKTIIQDGYGAWIAALWLLFMVLFIWSTIHLAKSYSAIRLVGSAAKFTIGTIALLFGFLLGHDAARLGAPKASILLWSSPATLNVQLFGAYDDSMSDFDRRKPWRRWGWEMSHPDGMIYLIGLNSVLDRWYDRQYFASADSLGLTVFPTRRASSGEPVGATLTGVANTFAMRVDAVTFAD